MTTLGSDGGDDRGRAKRRRVDEQGCRFEEEEVEEAAATEGKGAPQVIPDTRFSDLPIDVRYRILTFLPIKDAIRTSAVDPGWRDLWKSRWHPASCRDIHLLPGADVPDQVLSALESAPPLRLDRLSLLVENRNLRQWQLRRFMLYASKCGVEDLHVELLRRRRISNNNNNNRGWDLSFHFPLASPSLVHLSLRGIRISSVYLSSAAVLYSALEVIHLHSVHICQWSFRKIMALCPSLRTLDMRRCNFREVGRPARVPVVLAVLENLRSLVVAECEGEVRLNAVDTPSLVSFWYSGSYGASPFFLPRDAPLAHLYISCDDPLSLIKFTLFPRYFDEGLPDDLSRLTELTMCSNALKVASTWLHNGATARWTTMSNLQSLRELQLVMFNMDANNLADIYVFLKGSNCPNLERVFVQFPVSDYVPLESSSEEVALEPPKNGLRNLRMVRVTNFHWRRFEVQLVSFLLKRATSLEKLQVVSSASAMLNVAGAREADILVIQDALDKHRMMLSGPSDDALMQPFHSKGFIDI